MDWDGFYPKGITCRCCGKELEGKCEGHPAESYAGTYNGLCDTCTLSGEFELNYSMVSGARVYNFPPHCPSWRRARETYYGFDGCEACKGKGRVWISRSDAEGGSYTVQCALCWAKHESHPLVQKMQHKEHLRMVKSAVLVRRLDQKYQKGLRDAGWTTEVGQNVLEVPALKAVYEACRDELQAVEAGAPVPEDWPPLKASDRKNLVKTFTGSWALTAEETQAIVDEWSGRARRRGRKCSAPPASKT